MQTRCDDFWRHTARFGDVHVMMESHTPSAIKEEVAFIGNVLHKLMSTSCWWVRCTDSPSAGQHSLFCGWDVRTWTSDALDMTGVPPVRHLTTYSVCLFELIVFRHFTPSYPLIISPIVKQINILFANTGYILALKVLNLEKHLVIVYFCSLPCSLPHPLCFFPAQVMQKDVSKHHISIIN